MHAKGKFRPLAGSGEIGLKNTVYFRFSSGSIHVVAAKEKKWTFVSSHLAHKSNSSSKGLFRPLHT